MVPADDEHKDTPEGDSNASTEDRNSGRLTPMPDWLMKWWIPIPLALFLLALGCFLASIWHMPLRPVSWQESKLFWPPSWPINPFWPPSWPFNYHWPSKDAMALCTTIAGAGFAFATWQQRSHDNAAKAKQAQAAIERDDYWKRREQVYQLLGSKNPRLRLGAVALLAELADSAAHSSFLNKTEKQQLQRHIINTLCLQVRREGLLLPDEGDKDDHIEVQRAILQSIMIRINSPSKRTPHAEWSTEDILLHNCRIFTTISFHNIHTVGMIDLSNSILESPIVISQSRIENIHWATAQFHGAIHANNNQGNNFIRMDGLPEHSGGHSFINTTLICMYGDPYIQLNNLSDENKGQFFEFRNCDFLRDVFPFAKTHKPSGFTYPKTSLPKDMEHFSLAPIHIYEESNDESNDAHSHTITFIGCRIIGIKIAITQQASSIDINNNTIFDFIEIQVLDSWNQYNASTSSNQYREPISITNNTFTATSESLPARLLYRSTTMREDQVVTFTNNRITDPNRPTATLPLQLEHCILVHNEDA